jgi:DNA topoisomerase-1
VSLLAEAKSGGRRGPELLRELGPHPAGGAVPLYRGRYGPYVSHDGVIASLPKGADPDSFALDAAVALLATQRTKGKPRRAVSKAPTSKPRARKAASAAASTISGNGAKKPARRAAAKPRSKPALKAAAKRPVKVAAKAARRPPA